MRKWSPLTASLIAALAALLMAACSYRARIEDPEIPLAYADSAQRFSEQDFPLKRIHGDLDEVWAACEEILANLPVTEGGYFYAPSAEEFDQMAQRIGELGYTVAGDNTRDMIHCEPVLEFWDKLARKETAAITVFQLHSTMVVAETLVTKGGESAFLPVYHEFAVPGDGPDEVYRTVGAVEQVETLTLTPKGYLLFRYRDAAGNEWRDGCRVLPLGERNLRLTAYVPPYDETGNNLTAVDWERDNLDALHLLEMVPWLARDSQDMAAYRSGDVYLIPGQLVEGILTTALPVSAGSLRALSAYDDEEEVYRLPVRPAGCPPEPEVVDAMRNPDGSWTLTVDYVQVRQGEDRYASSRLTLYENPDGSVRYVRNQVL